MCRIEKIKGSSKRVSTVIAVYAGVMPLLDTLRARQEHEGDTIPERRLPHRNGGRL